MSSLKPVIYFLQNSQLGRILYKLKFSRGFYFREFRESQIAKITTLMYVYM